ncbi:GNAT family N-acetyltransferase [Thalassovita sp.]|uniref:GNAT family N-acetyltransferase n=1 Tax=Thalassovita sp. TaxID=1979401 RepID=UPI002B270322|nr:GNAT family N-acetyltransferase [Thalassovita sp.]
MTIRQAQPQDAAAVAEIWNDVIRSSAATFTNLEKTEDGLIADFAAKEADGKTFLMAELDGEVVGFATYFQFRGGPGYRHTMEHTVILSPRAWGRGIGRRLMTAIEDHARAGGAHSLFGGVSAENADGIAFHTAIGFKEIARLPEVGRKFDRWMDLVLMQKIL